jgi:hypothetical protein
MSDFPTMGELCEPQEGQAVRFCTAFSISQDTKVHGINGFYRNGRFWSVDMADHWTPHEVTRWQSTSRGAESALRTHLSSALGVPGSDGARR